MFIYSIDKHSFPHTKSINPDGVYKNHVGTYINADAVLRFIPYTRNFSPEEINFDIFLNNNSWYYSVSN